MSGYLKRGRAGCGSHDHKNASVLLQRSLLGSARLSTSSTLGVAMR